MAFRRVARTGASPIGSGPEGSSPNEFPPGSRRLSALAPKALKLFLISRRVRPEVGHSPVVRLRRNGPPMGRARKRPDPWWWVFAAPCSRGPAVGGSWVLAVTGSCRIRVRCSHPPWGRWVLVLERGSRLVGLRARPSPTAWGGQRSAAQAADWRPRGARPIGGPTRQRGSAREIKESSASRCVRSGMPPRPSDTVSPWT